MKIRSVSQYQVYLTILKFGLHKCLSIWLQGPRSNAISMADCPLHLHCHAGARSKINVPPVPVCDPIRVSSSR